MLCWVALSDQSVTIPACQFYLALIYKIRYNKLHKIEDHYYHVRDEKSFGWLLKAAKNGNVHAKYIVGLNYEGSRLL